MPGWQNQSRWDHSAMPQPSSRVLYFRPPAGGKPCTNRMGMAGPELNPDKAQRSADARNLIIGPAAGMPRTFRRKHSGANMDEIRNFKALGRVPLPLDGTLSHCFSGPFRHGSWHRQIFVWPMQHDESLMNPVSEKALNAHRACGMGLRPSKRCKGNWRALANVLRRSAWTAAARVDCITIVTLCGLLLQGAL